MKRYQAGSEKHSSRDLDPETFRDGDHRLDSNQERLQNVDPNDSNLRLELLVLGREKEQLSRLTKQLEQKLALKDQQLANHTKQLQLRQKAQQSLEEDS